jgi:thiosulfate/3-mercaptopyruvate sulfurtransferase
MDYRHADSLVETSWLAKHLQAPDVHVVDASWYMPSDGRDPKAEFRERHVPGAVFFDIDEIADTSSPLPHMLPTPEKFTARARSLGLGDGNRIIVYDGAGLFSAARVWWMFRVFGHDDIAILNGGFPKWLREGWPVVSGPAMPRERHFTARMNNLLMRDFDHMWSNLETGHDQVLDARSPGRFKGITPEPREGSRSGHIPGSVNLPYTSVLNPEDKTLLPAEALAARFAEAGADLSKPIATTCGSGVTAPMLAFALYLLGHEEAAVYDGSWAEWGSRDEAPVERL